MVRKLIFPEETEGVKKDLRVLIEQHGSTKLPWIADSIKSKGLVWSSSFMIGGSCMIRDMK